MLWNLRGYVPGIPDRLKRQPKEKPEPVPDFSAQPSPEPEPRLQPSNTWRPAPAREWVESVTVVRDQPHSKTRSAIEGAVVGGATGGKVGAATGAASRVYEAHVAERRAPRRTDAAPVHTIHDGTVREPHPVHRP